MFILQRESVVPVTKEDYDNKKKFGSIEEMQRFRKAVFMIAILHRKYMMLD